MNKSLLLASALLALSPALPAQDGAASRARVGQVDLEWRTSALYTPTALEMRGRVRMTSADYDLSAEDVKAAFAPALAAGGPPRLQKAVALPAPGAQVAADIRRSSTKEAYNILADKAVYLPDAARPGYGRMDFTGHVRVSARSGFSVGPAVTTTDHATVLLGPDKALYPQVETGPGHVTLTPAP